MPPIPEIRAEERWYAPLVDPVRPAVDASLERLGELSLGDPWAKPRTGLGAALVLHVARSYGTRRWREAARVATSATEMVNQRMWQGEPGAAERTRWMALDASRIRRVWRLALRRDRTQLHRVVDRIIGTDAELGDHPIPEAVGFFRGAVAAGVLCGDVPDPLHAELDALAVWLGLAWETRQAPLPRSHWHGALRAIDAADTLPGDDPAATAIDHALAVCERLPHAAFTEALAEALAAGPAAEGGHRVAPAWVPERAPEPRPVLVSPGPSAPGTDALHAFSAAWRRPIEDAMAALVATPATSLARSLAYLQGQGGKRLRPLLTLAATAACGGDPRAALPGAAAIEWLHQASLIVDDVIDEARVRRNGPTLHAATSTPYAFGVFAFVLSRIHLAHRALPAAHQGALADAGTVLADGQWSELHRTGDLDLSLTDYHRIIHDKTASLFSAAAVLGACAADAPPARTRAVATFGREAGLAFQVVDDLLDYLGTASALGKTPGTDLRAGKVTLPILVLREALTGADRDRLADLFVPGARISDADLAWVTDQMTRLRIRDECLGRARTHRRRALDALAPLPASEGRDVLAGLATRFVERHR